MIDIVGIGEGGWESLGAAEQRIITQARVVVGGRRHLDLLPEIGGQERREWPSPLRENLPGFLDEIAAVAAAPGAVAALASGDPLVSGIGTTIVEMIGAENVTITPAVSSEAWARARMAWPAETTTTVSLVGRPLENLDEHLRPGQRLIVLCGTGADPARIANHVSDSGFDQAPITAWWHLGGPDEGTRAALARDWEREDTPDLVLVCVDLATVAS